MPSGYDTFLVEFAEPDDPRPVAFAYVHPHEARPEIEGGRARCRFWKNATITQTDEAVAR